MNRHHVIHYVVEAALVMALVLAVYLIDREQAEVDSVARTHGYYGFNEGVPR